MNLKRLIKLIVLLTSALYLSGCAFMYRSLDTATDERASGIWSTDGCQISYLIRPQVADTVYPRVTVLSENADFSNAPHIEDYKSWTETTISELGCKPIQASTDVTPDIVLAITEYPLPNQYAQGERFLATFTLYLIPIPMQQVGYRRYEFGSSRGGLTRRVYVVQKGWLGWVFLPLFPFSFSSYAEQGIFKSQFREYLSGK